MSQDQAFLSLKMDVFHALSRVSKRDVSNASLRLCLVIIVSKIRHCEKQSLKSSTWTVAKYGPFFALALAAAPMILDSDSWQTLLIELLGRLLLWKVFGSTTNGKGHSRANCRIKVENVGVIGLWHDIGSVVERSKCPFLPLAILHFENVPARYDR